jgi:hypothetical protein
VVEPFYESDVPVGRAEVEPLVALHRLEQSYQELVDELVATQRARDLALEMLAECEERLARVRALLDLAEWARENDRDLTSASVRSSDLQRALE